MNSKSILILVLIMVGTFAVAFKLEGPFVPEASAATGATDTVAASSGRLIVGFKELAWTFPIQDFVAQYGGGQVAGINYVLKFAVIVPKQAATFEAFASQDPRVSYIEPDSLLYALFTPNDPLFPSQWGPPAIYATSAWDITLGSKSVVVAVVDTGVQYDHPDLKSNMWRNSDGTYGWNFVRYFGPGNAKPYDDNGHGTHVAGIVAATIDNVIGVAGTSQSSIMAVKVLDSSGSGYTSWVASGIQWATDNGARIISMSLGGPKPSPTDLTLPNAVTYAYDRGVLLVAAAGNKYGGAIQYPAGYDEVIAVTALDQNSRIASFSSTGPQAELSAPGVSIQSTCTSYNTGSPCYGSQYKSLSGTSMATPFVSGVAALMWSVDPTLSRDTVRSFLDSTADDLGSPGRDSYYGYGRVDALGAVQAAGGSPPPPPPPDFTITLSRTALTVTTGGSGQLNVQVKGSNGFSAQVTLSTENLPGGVTSNLVPSTEVPDFTSVLTITAASSAVPGTYSITVKADGGGITKTQALSLKIQSTSNQLVVTVTTDRPYYPKGWYVFIKVRVTDGNGNPISGAYVEVKVNYPSGTLYRKFTGNTDANGYFKPYFWIDYSMPSGTYTVRATATKTGYVSGSGSITFLVI